MESFTCSNCGQKHKLSTLMEFPQPEIISKISSGKVDSKLEVIAKNFYSIDKRTIICQSELEIEILEMDDELQMLVWAQINPTEFLEAYELGKEKGLLEIKAQLLHSIPFYKNSENLEINLFVDMDKNENPKVKGIRNHPMLHEDMQKGITKNDLLKLYSKLCKLANEK